MEYVMDGRLGRAAQGMGCSEGVKPVLQNIVIGGRQRDRAEVVTELIDTVELVVLKCLGALVDQDRGLVQRPLVEHIQLRHGHGMLRRIEIKKIRELKTEGIADQPIGFAHVFQDLVVHRNVVAKILRCDPETDYIRAILLDIGVGCLGLLVGAALGNFLPVLVDDEAVGQHGLVGRSPIGDDTVP